MTAETVVPFVRPRIAEGLYRLSDMPEPPPIQVWQTGFADWTPAIRLAPGMLSVVTGLPGHGKTQVFTQIWFNIVRKYEFAAAIAAFETPTKPHYRRYLRQHVTGLPEKSISESELKLADAFINQHYRWLVHPSETPTLGWILDVAERAVAHDGVRVLQIDPWNRLESQREARETEPDYIARCLRDLHLFAKDLNCHVQIIAHPAKRDGRMRDRIPELEDIAGAMHWWNMPDQGFVVHRKKFMEANGARCFDAEFVHRKARFEELGYPCVMSLRMDAATGRFQSVASGE